MTNEEIKITPAILIKSLFAYDHTLGAGYSSRICDFADSKAEEEFSELTLRLVAEQLITPEEFDMLNSMKSHYFNAFLKWLDKSNIKLVVENIK